MSTIRGSDLGSQEAFARATLEPHADLLRTLRHDTPQHPYQQAIARNGEAGYGPTEAEFLYCFIRTHKPKHIVQVGCGVSTALIQIAAKDAAYSPKVTCVEPYPTAMLREEDAAGRIRLIAEPAQTVALETYTSLATGDLLFIDSTHTTKPGSEVNRLFLEAIPALAPGVFIHVHDIYFPFDYSPQVLDSDIFFWREQVLLMALLTMNPGLEILACLAMLGHNHPQPRESPLIRLIPNFKPATVKQGIMVSPGHYPSSIFLRRV
jgi:predicted O-methyltransferase YrrM